MYEGRRIRAVFGARVYGVGIKVELCVRGGGLGQCLVFVE